MKQMTIPKKLERGARVALLSPASPVSGEENLKRSIQAVEALGFVPEIYESCYLENKRAYLAASDEVRARDVMRAFTDERIDGVFALRGGYGCERILPLLDLDAVARHPKFFAGYSDITALHIAFNQNCDMVTYHAIMPSSDYADGVDDFSMKEFLRCVNAELKGEIANPNGVPFKTLYGGRGNASGEAKARGAITGGNLSLVVRSLGTPWEIDTRDKLLFLEDVGEAPYRIDGMLTQLRNSGKLAACAGLMLGYFTELGDAAENRDKSLSLDEVFLDLLPKDVPTVTGVCCGHKTPTIALPMGCVGRLESGRIVVE